MRQTIKQLLQSAHQQIDKLDADLLLSFILNKPREYFLIHDAELVNNIVKSTFHKLLRKRKLGMPMAYLTGHKEFFGLDFLVNKYTLIPRPDTEILVENVIKTINKKQLTKKKLLLIDIGAGSGCIPISILKNTQDAGAIKTLAVDIYKKALLIAEKNTQKHKVKIKFLHGNLLEPILKSKIKFDNVIITANLPYLTETQYQSEKSIQHEPKSALVAKKEGLALYEELFNQIKQLSLTYNLKPQIYVEIDPSQSQKITALINQILPNSQIEIKKDLAQRDRLVIIEK